MTEKEKRELDAWVAERVIGWHRMTNAKAIGVEDFSEFDERELETLNRLSDNWYDSKNNHVADVEGECDCGQHDTSFKPTTDPAAAMEVLKKCVEQCDMPVEIDRKRDKKTGHWRIESGTMSQGLLVIAPPDCNTLELAICLFAKKLFSK